MEECVLRPNPVAGILVLVLERSLETWICPLVIVRLSLLVVREDLISLLYLSFILSELCLDICVLFSGKRARHLASERGVIGMLALTRLNSYSAVFLSSGFALSG